MKKGSIVSKVYKTKTIEELLKDGTLILKHEHDGRDLDLSHANKVVEHIRKIWQKDVKLYTVVEDEVWEI